MESKQIKNFGNITINGKEYDIYIARSEEQKSKGFQGFSSLPDDEGMLFINDSPKDVFYHMKNVGMPLDLIFMDEDLNVISVKQGKPNDETPIKETNVMYVLEVNTDSGIKKGDTADLDDDETHEYVMKVLSPDGTVQMKLEGGERIVSRRESRILIRKALKASKTNEDKDYKALGKYIFKVLKGQDSREPEYVESPK